MFEPRFSRFESHNQFNIYFFKDIEIPKDFYPDQPYIIRTTMFRGRKNMNTFILIVGNPRTSKSYCAIKVAETYSGLNNRVFDVEKQLTFDDIKKFLIWSKNAEDSIFILDETGTTLSPDQFWSLQQRIMRRFIQTQGFRRNVLIWVLPSVVFIQKAFRFLTNYAMMTRRQGMVDVYKVVVNQLIGKGFPDRIETMKFDLPSEETINIYERLKKEWNDLTIKDDVDWLEEIEKPTFRRMNLGYYINAYQNNVIDEVDLKIGLEKNSFDPNDVNMIIQNELNKKESNKPNQPSKAELLSTGQRQSLELGISLAK
jgi:hypothetical protein